MIVKPASLAEWSLDVVREIAASGIAENDWYDFKADLQPAEHQRKSVAAFANTQGGFLVFGVNSNREIVGLNKPELPRDFGIKLAKDLFPSPAFEFAPPPAAHRKSISLDLPRSSQQAWPSCRFTEWILDLPKAD